MFDKESLKELVRKRLMEAMGEDEAVEAVDTVKEPETKPVVVDDLKKATIDFIKNKPTFKMTDIDEFHEKIGKSADEVLAMIFTFAEKYVKLMTEGRSVEKGITVDKVDAKELEMGMEVEKEHSEDSETRQKISLDHLSESNGKLYYTLLTIMEKLLENIINISKEEQDKKIKEFQRIAE